MVAGKDAEPAGIIRNRFVKTEFGGKISNRVFDCATGAGLSVSVVSPEIFLEFLKDLFQLAQESFVLGELFQTRLARELQHAHWIVVGPIP